MFFFKEIPMLLSFILIFSGIASVSLASWSLSCRKKVFGSREFSLFLFSVAVYCFGYAHEINKYNISGIFDSLRIQFIGIPFTAVLFLMFSIKLVTGKKLNYYLNILLLVIPVITVFIVFNLEKHDLFYITASVKNDGIFPVLIYQSGPWYIVNIINLLLSSAAAEIILAVSYFRTKGNRKQQILFVFLSGLLPFMSALVNPARFHNFDIQPFVLSITGLLLAIALFRYKMFDLIPHAREIAVDTIKELLVVFDREGNVQDINLSAKKSEMLKDIIIGAPLPEKCPFKRFVIYIKEHENSIPDNLEYQFDYEENTYLLKISFIESLKKSDSGYVFIISNITESVSRIKELEYQAIYNSLTGIFNRRHIMNLAVREIQIAHAANSNIGLILMDIDYFKTVNDKYGHYAGDCVLKETAKILGRELRVSDLLGRIGGEEFLVVCPATDSEKTASIAERLRTAVESHIFAVDGEKIKITSSFGVYSKTPLENENIDDLLKNADIALYLAKKQGRNRTEIYND